MARERRYDLLDRLTPREREVRELLRAGLTDAQIAERLGVSKSAVSHHVSSIISKLGVRNRYEAAHWPAPPPWWAKSVALIALLWRKAGGFAPKASTAALTASGATFLILLGGLALIAVLLLRGAGDAGADREVASREALSRSADDPSSEAGLALSTEPAPTATPGAPAGGQAPSEQPSRGVEAGPVGPAALRPASTPTPAPPSEEPPATSAPDATSTPAPAAPGPNFGVMAVDCDGAQAGLQRACAYAPGAEFRVQVHVALAPVGGYRSFKVVLAWGDGVVSYEPAPDPADENRWTGCDWPLRFDAADPLQYGCFSLSSPVKASTRTGAVLEFQFACRQNGATSLDLLTADAANPKAGTHFKYDILNPVETHTVSAHVACGDS